MTSIAFLQKAGGSIVVFVNGKPYNVDPTSLNYKSVVEAIEMSDYPKLVELLDIRKAIADYTNGKIEVYGDDVYYNKKLMKGALSERIVHMFRQNMLVSPFVNFMEKVQQNPLDSAKEELFLFAESNNLPICPDGDFLAYKYVDRDYLDSYSQTISNKVGNVIQMNRELVNPDRHQTCSYGLHVCSFEYVKSHKNSHRLMVVKVNPTNVVAIPSDYNNQKMRVCEYVVVDELTEWSDLLEKNYTEEYAEWEEEDQWDEEDEEEWEDSNREWESSYEEEWESSFEEDEEEDEEDESVINHLKRINPEWKTVENNEKVRIREFNKADTGPNITSKVSEDDVRRIRRLLSENWSLAAIAREFGISARQVARIRDGEAWIHIS